MDTNTLKDFEPMPYFMVGWNGESPVFTDLIREVQPSVIIEVGTWMGMSACHMADLAPQARIYCVDTWLGSSEFWIDFKDTPDRNLMLRYGYPQCYYQFLSNIIHRGCVGRIEPVPVSSDVGADILRFQGVQADLIYIDAGHSCSEVLRDIACYKPLLRPGGVMFGDDVLYWPGVTEAAAQVGAVTENDKWVLRL